MRVTLGDVKYRVPRPFLRDPTFDGRVEFIGMWALLPDFEPLSPKNIARFDDASPNSRVVLFTLRYAKSFRYPSPDDQLADLIRRKILSGEAEQGEFGLLFYPVINTSGIDKNYKFYFARYPPKVSVMLQCNLEHTVPSPACSSLVFLGNGIYLQYSYKSQNLRAWKDINQRILGLVQSFRDE